jgi:hypothetical protein
MSTSTRRNDRDGAVNCSSLYCVRTYTHQEPRPVARFLRASFDIEVNCTFLLKSVFRSKLVRSLYAVMTRNHI